ncbi:flagellar biosynthetic protein FliO [Paenisporosarcina sp. HGH0030]|uniref:flagellar biosynthetic protein FliO n=1 Tax=Paenisporosarcina sp. HGH0030 TaxID=1078085 RepID=UPI00034E74A4|nr:flagellar biosynthetic protein FliO [Paenisporosarcina sp. HGH0030]EPD49620.1 flagellar biosynthetic protein FliO [Paenisporosarcina sp. HGH0030]
MIQKRYVKVLAMILLFTLYVMLTPNLANAAKDPTVKDWAEDKEKQSDEQLEPVVDEELKPTQDTNLVTIIIKLIFYTLLILVMIYGLIKFLAVRQKKFQPNQAVKLMGGTPLGNNKSLQLVKVGDKVYLLGVADQVTLIKEFSNTDEISSIENDLEQQPNMLANPIMNLSNSIVDFSKEKISKRLESKPTNGFEQLFKQSLNKQKSKQDQLKQDLNKADDEKEGKSE